MSKTLAKVLEVVTVHRTNALRFFADVVCPAFPNTVETYPEYRARRDAQAKRAQEKSKKSVPASSLVVVAGGKRHKTFSLETYTDVQATRSAGLSDTIRRLGATDSHSTQIVCVFVCAKLS